MIIKKRTIHVDHPVVNVRIRRKASDGEVKILEALYKTYKLILRGYPVVEMRDPGDIVTLYGPGKMDLLLKGYNRLWDECGGPPSVPNLKGARKWAPVEVFF